MIYLKQWTEAFGIPHAEHGYEPEEPEEPENEIDETALINDDEEPELIDLADSTEFPIPFPDEF